LDDFIAPKQVRHHDRIDFGIGGGVSQYSEVDSAPWSLLGRDYAAPFRRMTHDACDMLRRGDKCKLL